MQRLIEDLYIEADQAIARGSYADASLLQSQADNLYQFAENLGTVITEQQE